MTPEEIGERIHEWIAAVTPPPPAYNVRIAVKRDEDLRHGGPDHSDSVQQDRSARRGKTLSPVDRHLGPGERDRRCR